MNDRAERGPLLLLFARGFLIAGPEAAVRRTVDVAQGEAPALADAPNFEAALEGARRPVQGYLSPRGLRGYVRAQGGVAGTVAALIDRPQLKAVGASLRADARGLRVHARLMGTAAPTGRPRLLDDVPGDAVAMLAGPSLAAAVQAAQRAGETAALDTVRSTLQQASSPDLEARPPREAARRVHRPARARPRRAGRHARGPHERPRRHARGPRAAAGPAGARACR